MAERAAERMGIEEFMLWAEQREDRYELVDGVPQMMAGAKRRHDRIVMNLVWMLRTQLTGRTCEPFGADTAVVTPNGNVRLPDAGVDCGEADNDERTARDPVLVVEVLSPSTRDVDQRSKLEEYKALPTMQYILLVDPERASATLWSRGAGGVWSDETISGMGATVSLPALDLALPFADLYARVTFPPRPRLVT